MGVDKIKITITCTCGCNYGNNCGKKRTYVFVHNTVVDIYGLHVDGKKIWCGNDEDLTALMFVLQADPEKSEPLTEEEKRYTS